MIFLFSFFALTAAVWFYRAWRSLSALKNIPAVRTSPPSDLQTQKLVSVIIPAKNEEKNIRTCVESLLRQTYQNLEILVINNGSTDQTEEILKSMGISQHLNSLLLSANRGTDKSSNILSVKDPVPRIFYMNTESTPEGWTGKNFALHTGVAEAKGKWFIFTDADTRHEPQAVSAVIHQAESNNLSLLSLLPRCIAQGFFENLIQPCAMAFTGLWFPMEKVNDPNSPVYFANGQYLVMERELYRQLEGHAAVRGEFLEDFALMKAAKQRGYKTQCAFGTEIYGTRMYDSLAAIWRGWRRIYLHAFSKNPWLIFSKFMSVCFFTLMPFALVPAITGLFLSHPQHYRELTLFMLIVLLFILGTAWKTYGIIKANRFFSLLHPAGAFFIALILLDAARMAVFNLKTKWR